MPLPTSAAARSFGQNGADESLPYASDQRHAGRHVGFIDGDFVVHLKIPLSRRALNHQVWKVRSFHQG